MRGSRLVGRLVLCACVAVGVLMAGCGSSEAPLTASPTPVPTLVPTPMPVSCPDPGDVSTAATILPELLPSAETMFDWQRLMVDLGPRFTGSPALRGWHDFMAERLEGFGLDVQREPIPIDWWEHRKWSLKLIENGVETEVPAASYFPYSGHTPEGGIVADLANAGLGLPTDLVLSNVGGKIAYIQSLQVPTTMALFYISASNIHDPDRTITPLTDYTRMSLSFLLTPQLLGEPVGSLYFARLAGAVGAIIALNGSAENIAGQYTPFMGHPGTNYDVPTLFVDRATGDMIRSRIAAGAQARLELVVDEHLGDSTDDIVATLPGMSDEVIIVNTHTDGPSASEENGGIGVLALARYFSSLPIECRRRTMVFVLTPGHFHGGIGGDTDRFIEHHPEIVSRAVASLTPEHLGQMEWLDDASGFHASGLVEPAIFFGSSGSAMQSIMYNAVRAEDLRRVIISRPIAGLIYFGVGSPMNAAGVPNAGYITGPHSMLSFANNQHLDKTDGQRMAAEVRTFARVATSLHAADKADLCAGLLPGGEGACAARP